MTRTCKSAKLKSADRYEEYIYLSKASIANLIDPCNRIVNLGLNAISERCELFIDTASV